VKYREGDLAGLGGVEKTDVAQGGQRRRQQAGTNVDDGDGGARRVQRVEDLHLVRGRRHVDDFGDVGMETPQRAAWRFGIEGPGWHIVGAEIVQQGARDGGLADPPLSAPTTITTGFAMNFL